MPLATAIVGGGTSLISGYLGARAAGKAAAAQTDAENQVIVRNDRAKQESLAAQTDVYTRAKTNLDPYQQAGKAALSQIGGSISDGSSMKATDVLANDPGYQFRLDEGQQALERAQSASGSVGSGGALRAATRYGQNYAAGEYGAANTRMMQANQQRNSQLMSLANLGLSATNSENAAGTNFANESTSVDMTTAARNANAIEGIGNAQASGYVGAANAWSGALSNINQGINTYAAQRKPGTWNGSRLS